MERTPRPGELYRHFKGNLYRIVTLAEHTESGEQLVIYQALYGTFQVYARPLAMFVSKVDREKYPDVQEEYRFTLVPEAGAGLIEVPHASGMAISKETAPVRETDSLKEENTSKEETFFQEEAFPVEEEPALDPGLLAFLEADSYEKKLEVFDSLAGRVDAGMLNTMAISLDLELSGEDLEEQYLALKNCLLTLEKYECNRLR